MTPRPSIFLFNDGRSQWRMEPYKQVYLLSERRSLTPARFGVVEELSSEDLKSGHRFFDVSRVMEGVVLYVERGTTTWSLPRTKLLMCMLAHHIPRAARERLS